MKKIAIIAGVLLGAILMYLVGEQVYLYYKHDRNNVKYSFHNYSNHECVHLEMLIDGEIAYNADMLQDVPFTYYGGNKISMGWHLIEIKVDGQSLYKNKIITILNIYVDAEYNGDGSLFVRISSRPMTYE